MKILIVDDEAVSRNILIQKMGLIGECTAVEDGIKAIELFNKAIQKEKPFDLITLDVSMPKMDGIQVLEMIRKKEKSAKVSKEDQVKIIMVSARMNTATIKACIKLGCNGYITKPVTKYQLLGNLGRMGFEQPAELGEEDKNSYTKIVAEIIKRFYKGRIKLPVLPRIVNDVKELMDSKDAAIEDLVSILKNDIAISARLISIANSALYKGVDYADSLNVALVRLGMKASCNLISTIVTRDLFKTENKIINEKLEELWTHSFACGVIGKKLAQELGMENADTIFLMGIVHDIGKMLLIKAIVDMYPEELFESSDLRLAIHETHTTFGAALLKKMKFSKEFIQIAEFHHWSDFAKEDDRTLLVIQLSDYLAREIGFKFFAVEEEQDKFCNLAELESFKQLKLDLDKTIEMAEKIKETIASSAKEF